MCYPQHWNDAKHKVELEWGTFDDAVALMSPNASAHSYLRYVCCMIRLLEIRLSLHRYGRFCSRDWDGMLMICVWDLRKKWDRVMFAWLGDMQRRTDPGQTMGATVVPVFTFNMITQYCSESKTKNLTYHYRKHLNDLEINTIFLPTTTSRLQTKSITSDVRPTTS